jgi:hypothetical protein
MPRAVTTREFSCSAMANTETTSLSATLRLAKALALSRQGKISEAQALLAGDRTIPEGVAELHALAALVTSQGDYLRAAKLWELLLQREPGHVEAQRMIAAIELWLSRPAWVRFLPYGIGALVLGLIGWLVVALTSASPEVRAPRIINGNVPEGTNAPIVAPVPAEIATPTPQPRSAPPPVINFPEAKPVRRRSGR